MSKPQSTWDALWTDARIATMQAGSDVPYGGIEDAALGIENGLICWLGKSSELPEGIAEDIRVHSVNGRWVTPGLIDCHTHLVYAGDRAREFEMRLNGMSYEEIAKQGGGILSTVEATRAASEDALVGLARQRLRSLMAEGVTAVEVKSGYGLDLETELRMLRAARRLGESEPVDVHTTFLGAHALPPEFRERSDDYIDFVCEQVLPAVATAGLADAVDAFCEGIGFNLDQTRRVFEAASRHGLPIKLHAEQLSDMQGAALAASYDAMSADHLEYVSEDAVKEMARHGTVAVLLPGAFYFLRETRVPPVEWFRRYEVPMAVATDCNPGSSPVTSLLLMLNMACTLFDMTPEEALTGVTRHAAKALKADNRAGCLAVGRPADFVVWDIDHPSELAYHVGRNPCHHVVKSGVIVHN